MPGSAYIKISSSNHIMLGNDDHIGDNRLIIKFISEENNSANNLETSYRLLEVTDPNLLNALEEKKDLWIRGRQDDEAVLCSDTQTFKLRELITSNMFLVIEKSQDLNANANKFIGTVVGKPSATLEATLMIRPPGIDQLIKALKDSPYNGGISGEDEDFHGNDFIHVTRIYENVQASFKEIESCLGEQGAIVINGTINFILFFIFYFLDHFRILGNHLLCRFIELFFNTAILEDWNLASEPLNIEAILQSFLQYDDEYSGTLLEFILKFYSNTSTNGLFDFVKVSRFLAEQFLRAKPVWDLEDFMLAWEKSLCDLFKPDIDFIRDLMLIDKHPGSGRSEIKMLLRSDLPSDVDSRFIALFKIRSRWQYDELIPFIK